MALLQPPSFIQARTDHTAQEDRLYLEGLLARPGIGGLSAAAGVALIRAQAAPNMSVLVTKERFFIGGTESTSQGVYHGYNDGDVTVNIAASSPSLPRTDIIVAYIQDAFYSGASNQLVVDKVTGTPNASQPSPPAAPNNAIILGSILVAANATTITNPNITISAYRSITSGSPFPAASSALRDSYAALIGLYDGLPCYRQDTNNLEIYNGATWDTFTPKIANPVGAVKGFRTAALNFAVTTSDIIFDTTSHDYSAGAFSIATGVYTAAKTGLFSFKVKVGVSSSVGATEWALSLTNAANTVLSTLDRQLIRGMTAGDAQTLNGTDDIPLNAGDTVKVRVSSTAGTTTVLVGSKDLTYMSVSQVA